MKNSLLTSSARGLTATVLLTAILDVDLVGVTQRVLHLPSRRLAWAAHLAGGALAGVVYGRLPRPVAIAASELEAILLLGFRPRVMALAALFGAALGAGGMADR